MINWLVCPVFQVVVTSAPPSLSVRPRMSGSTTPPSHQQPQRVQQDASSVRTLSTVCPWPARVLPERVWTVLGSVLCLRAHSTPITDSSRRCWSPYRPDPHPTSWWVWLNENLHLHLITTRLDFIWNFNTYLRVKHFTETVKNMSVSDFICQKGKLSLF